MVMVAVPDGNPQTNRERRMSDVFRKSLIIAASAILAALIVAAHGSTIHAGSISSNLAAWPRA
jgi:hypothetical protein